MQIKFSAAAAIDAAAAAHGGIIEEAAETEPRKLEITRSVRNR